MLVGHVGWHQSIWGIVAIGGRAHPGMLKYFTLIHGSHPVNVKPKKKELFLASSSSSLVIVILPVRGHDATH